MQNKKVGFTLIELIVVLAIIGVLVGILVAVIKPQQIFARLRDTQRQSDLNRLANAIQTYIAEFAQNPSAIVLTADLGGINGCLPNASATIYYSANTQPPLSINIPSPSGFGTFTRATSSTSTKVDGTGWLRQMQKRMMEETPLFYMKLALKNILPNATSSNFYPGG